MKFQFGAGLLVLLLLNIILYSRTYHYKSRAFSFFTKRCVTGRLNQHHQREESAAFIGNTTAVRKAKVWEQRPPGSTAKRNAVKRSPSTAVDPRMVDIVGSIVEYRAKSGSKQIALVLSIKSRFTLEVMNDKKMKFTIHISRVAYQIKGKYSLGDLLRIAELQLDFKPMLIEKLWEKYSVHDSLSTDTTAATATATAIAINTTTAAMTFFRGSDNLREYIAAKLLLSHQGKLYFTSITDKKSELLQKKVTTGIMINDNYDEIKFIPNSLNVVQQNLRDRAALREFRQRYQRVITRIGGPLGGYDDGSDNDESNDDDNNEEHDTSSDYSFLSEMPERLGRVLSTYSIGLQYIVFKNHFWVRNGLINSSTLFHQEEEQIEKAKELLEFLGLSPNSKNARRVLEVTGIWSPHENIEKHLMQIRTQFPRNVLEEAKVLLENAEFLIDLDERLRRDLRHLDTYSIDREGTVEVDDALSIERLDNGKDKIWIHIADVSRWIRPGSELSIEAEKRMSSIYMPDERICMFPDILTTDLLSLSSNNDAYAISCGVTLNHYGEVTSYEVCPSRISLDRQLSYNELDYIINTHTNETNTENNNHDMNEMIEPLLKNVHENHYNSFGNNLRIKNISNQLLNYNNNKNYDSIIIKNLLDLNKYAQLRHQYRSKKGALDDLVRHRMELYLNVRMNIKNPFQPVTVSGTVNWSNSSSIRTVSEFMILMSETIGKFCMTIIAPVWYKIQSTNPPLSKEATLLKEGETSFLRASRILQHLDSAKDSLIPGYHCTSACEAYVQCTSPIRRYHDLYNHYRLKAAMHRASLNDQWAHHAEEEAGIILLDNMATAEERLKTLQNIRMVTKQREQYWLDYFIKSLISSKIPPIFDVVILQEFNHEIELQRREERMEYLRKTYNAKRRNIIPSTIEDENFKTYQAIILQLGSYTPFKLYFPKSAMNEIDQKTGGGGGDLRPGTKLQCHLYRLQKRNIYILLPIFIIDLKDFPVDIVDDIMNLASATANSNSRNKQ